MAVSAIALVAAGLVFWIVLRYFARFRARALALVLERRFPELGTRLITAVEMASSRSGRESPLTSAMIERTIDEAARLSSSLPLESVFDRAPLRRALRGRDCLRRFCRRSRACRSRRPCRVGAVRFVNRDAVYWPRETQLVVKAIVQPGDRVREFHDGRLKHPRGVDLMLLVEAPEGTKVPSAVELNYALDGGGTGRMEMVKSHEREFRHTISALLDSLSLWVAGGDYVSRTPLRVEVVDAPRLDQVTLDCDYPDYTGLDRDSQGAVTPHTVEVQGSQVAPADGNGVRVSCSGKQAARRTTDRKRDAANQFVPRPGDDRGPLSFGRRRT